MKKIDILIIKIAAFALKKRNLGRCMYISRRDNNDISYMCEKLDNIADRMKHNYKDLSTTNKR